MPLPPGEGDMGEGWVACLSVCLSVCLSSSHSIFRAPYYVTYCIFVLHCVSFFSCACLAFIVFLTSLLPVHPVCGPLFYPLFSFVLLTFFSFFWVIP